MAEKQNKYEQVRHDLGTMWNDGTFFTTSESEEVAKNALDILEEQQEEIERLKPKREGRWIPYMTEYGDMFQCDECEYIVRLAFKPQDKKCPYGYCPKCGKQMELS